MFHNMPRAAATLISRPGATIANKSTGIGFHVHAVVVEAVAAWDETLVLAASVSTRADIKFILLGRERRQKQITETRSFGSLSLILA
jgi:hypothetical protein